MPSIRKGPLARFTVLDLTRARAGPLAGCARSAGPGGQQPSDRDSDRRVPDRDRLHAAIGEKTVKRTSAERIELLNKAEMKSPISINGR